MNTAELKKLAELLQSTETEHMNINPTTILKLLAINAELVKALKLITAQDQGCGGNVTEAEAWRASQHIARAALTKAEGGEL